MAEEAAFLWVGEVEAAPGRRRPGPRLLRVSRRHVGETPITGLGDEFLERGRELLVEVAVGGDGQLVVAIHATCRGQFTEDSFGVTEVVLVDLQRRRPVGGLNGCGPDAFPGWSGGFGSRWATAEDHHVDNDVGA